MSSAQEFANPAVVEGQQQRMADAIENIRDQLEETPDPVPVTKVIQWFIDIVTSIISLIELIAMTYARRIMDIESLIRDAPPSSTKATATSSTTLAPVIVTISHLSFICLYLLSLMHHMHHYLLLFTLTRIQPRVRV